VRIQVAAQPFSHHQAKGEKERETEDSLFLFSAGKGRAGGGSCFELACGAIGQMISPL
jgi:hypothetical protein